MATIYLFNKPFNVLSQFSDKEGRSTLADYISTKGVYPAGRLDYDSEGLLLLTDDGMLQARIADPKFKLEKTYWVQVEGDITASALNELEQGVELKDGRTKPAKACRIAEPKVWERSSPIRQRKSIATSWISLQIREGKNRQVRRMTAAVGFPTLRLIRSRIGTWELGNLEPGQFQKMSVHLPSSSYRKQTKNRKPKHI